MLTVRIICRFYIILECKECLAKMKQFQTAKHHDVGPPETRAQCSCIGCIGLRPALLEILVSSTIVVWHIVLI